MSEPEITKDVEAKARPSKLAAEKALPRSGAETLIKIIKGYAVASNGGEVEVKFKDVASAAGINPTTVSGNNRFLEESEILSSPKYGFYVPSEGAIRFARESAWDENGAKSHLRKIIVNCWYGQVVIQNFTLRSSLSKSDLKRSLAIKCGASEGDSSALDSLIDFIIYTGLIEETEDGTLIRGNLDEVERRLELPNLAFDSQKPPIAAAREAQVIPEYPKSDDVSIVVHLHISNFDDLTEDHAARLKQWVESLKGIPKVQIQVTTDG